jgi:hypothetical protein
MTKDQNDYLKTWLFRANEDIAVIEKLLNQNLNYMPVLFVFMHNKRLKNSLKHSLSFTI